MQKMCIRDSRYDVDLLYFQWVDHFLRDVENGVEKGAPVEYFTIGEDKDVYKRQSLHR